MPTRAIRRTAVAILFVSSLAAACAAAVPTPSATDAARTPGVSPTRVTDPTREPGRTTSTIPSEPPAASLAAEGGDPAVGQLGSFTWQGGGSDSPWLPGTRLAVGSGEQLSMTLADDIGVGDWSARRVPAGATDGSAAVALGGGAAPVSFEAPGPGAWSVQVVVRFAGGLGSAAYYWQLDVR